MDAELTIRAVCLYWPLLVLLVLAVWQRPGYHERVGLLLAVLWNLATLPLVSGVAVEAGWWRFASGGPAALGLPLELYLGWAAWWGGVLPLAGLLVFRRSLPACAVAVVVVAALVDALAMPLLVPVLVLAPGWWRGEVLLLAAVLVPGLLVAWWTARRTCLAGRVLVQAGLFSMGFFLLVPGLAAGGWGWLEVPARPWWLWALFGAAAAGLALLGFAAVWEFARRGGGTPVPFDPPVRLVTSGPYARLANPMQVAMTGLLLLWGLWFGQAWLLVLAALGVAYSEGLARFTEEEDHRRRFGGAWTTYRSRVRRWWPGRRRPPTAGGGRPDIDTC